MGNKLIKTGYLMLFLVSIIFIKTVFSKHEIIKNNNHFSRIIRNPKYNLAVAMFYNSAKSARKEDHAVYAKTNNLVKMFKDASFIFKYNDADLMFLAVNMLEKNNSVFSSIYEITDVPRFMLFRDGQVYLGADRKPLVLRGFVTRPQLQSFIDSNFGTKIQENRERNKEIREKKIEQNLANSYYWGGGWGGYYPYGGYSPYWGGGYWGGGWGGYGGGYWGGSIGAGGYFGGGRGGYAGGRGGCAGGRGGGRR